VSSFRESVSGRTSAFYSGVFTEEIVKKLLQGREKITHQQFEEDSPLDDEASERSDFDDFDDRPCNE